LLLAVSSRNPALAALALVNQRSFYQRVAEELCRQIAAGELALRTAIPSTAELMRQYGVSRITSESIIFG
jgi:DNA-binding GntR family transcriptional regulator